MDQTVTQDYSAQAMTIARYVDRIKELSTLGWSMQLHPMKWGWRVKFATRRRHTKDADYEYLTITRASLDEALDKGSEAALVLARMGVRDDAVQA